LKLLEATIPPKVQEKPTKPSKKVKETEIIFSMPEKPPLTAEQERKQ
jgi:hypothetical protein